MSMFSTLLGKIFSHGSAPAAGGASTPTDPQPVGGSPNIGGVSAPAGSPTADPASAPAAAPSAAPVAPAPAPTATPAQPVDVGAILDDLKSKSSESLDWKKSIVDMMKLLGMDSGLSARKQLATELGYTGDEGDSAAMNVWLHKEVLKKLAENGGKVPAELLS